MTDEARRDTPLVAASGLHFRRGIRRVLHDVNLALRPGRHYVVAGPNGAGKSTLLHLLANLLPPESGEVAVAGRDVRSYPPPELARLVAVAPQEFALPFAFTVREVVAMGRRPYLGRWGGLDDADHAAVAAALSDAHLDAVADRPVTALSGGERRRCVVARALAQSTPILLLDEPDSGLDVAQAMSVMAVARRLAGQGRLVMTVSHDLNLSAAYGDEFIFLKDGRLAAHGPVANVFTAKVLSSIYAAEARVRRDDFTGALSVAFRPA